jgi:uncharacterized protein GlcG (DUF336 family)
MIKRVAGVLSVSLLGGVLLFPAVAAAQNNQGEPCSGLPSNAALKSALEGAVAAESAPPHGLHNQMWATIVNRDGFVCAVAFTGVNRGAQWPASRVISAQKANTANGLSLDPSSFSGGAGQLHGLALSTANLWFAVQPGGSLYGLQHSNPVDTAVAYGGDPTLYGTGSDPMVGQRIGGVNVFGGGLALYATTNHVIVGGVGVSGDTSCEDHFVAWRVRNNLGLDHLGTGMTGVPGPASLFAGDANHPDNIIFDLTPSVFGGPDSSSPSGFGHPKCALNGMNVTGDQTALPNVEP